ncbi:hypothetical protein RRG08_024255 [Elysia crispata]|uniref:Uncharacterized protein n=1 Tax=Elysia crispata TaxID=231223 RepID=A0AAE0Z242_9GAST|nr:hypothetical protein RRG08_024255 [Elysia crispata]
MSRGPALPRLTCVRQARNGRHGQSIICQLQPELFFLTTRNNRLPGSGSLTELLLLQRKVVDPVTSSY